MKQQRKQQGRQNKQSQKRYEYQICQVQSAGCIKKWGIYLSQPFKYLGTHVLLHFGMGLHYYATFSYLHDALGIINIILHLFCTSMLIILAFTDPGMIPKIYPNYEKMQFSLIPIDYQRLFSVLKYYKKQYLAPIKGHNLKLKFCNTCFIYRPPRTVHCSECGICIQKFDHHCSWIGTCVAKRNYKFFLFFIGALSVLTLKIFIQTIVVTVMHTKFSQGADILAKSVLNVFLCIYIFPAMGFSVCLFLLHLRLAATNLTTNQFCKQIWDTLSGNPYKKQSFFKNLLKIISLSYQGKVNNFQEPVYDRNNLVAKNQPITQQVDCQNDITIDNFNPLNTNKTNHKSHQDQSKKHGSHETQQKYEKTQILLRLTNKKQVNKQQIERCQKQQNHTKTYYALGQKASIYDINLKLNRNSQIDGKNQEKENEQEQKGSQYLRQKETMSQKSQKDQQEQDQDQLQRYQQNRLKVTVGEKKQQSPTKSPIEFPSNIVSSQKQFQKQ